MPSMPGFHLQIRLIGYELSIINIEKLIPEIIITADLIRTFRNRCSV